LKHVRLSPRLAPLGFATALACSVAFAPTVGGGASAQSPQAPPPPPAPNSTPTSLQTPGSVASPLPSGAPVPTATPSPASGRRGRRRPDPAASPSASANPEPTSTPTSPAFSTLDGTWEVQVQHIDNTEYSYFTIVQSGTSALSGTWRANNKEYPLEGTYDGRLIRMVVKQPTGSVTFSGYVEGASDMVGTLDFGVPKADPTAFTAEHRGSRSSVFKKKP